MKLSIITVCFNNKKGLVKTLESVEKQVFRDFEFIVIDGGSTDGTNEILSKNQSLFSYWVSEKDNGIYHAMNKGILKAKGEYCLFLNSGDYLADPTVLSDVFLGTDDSDIIYGNIIKVKPHYRRLIKYPSSLSFYDFYKEVAAIHHQASFIKRNLFELYGLYNEELVINADWDFFFRTIIVKKVKTNYVDRIISIYDGTGLSETIDKKNEKRMEGRKYKDDAIRSILPDYILSDYQKLNLLINRKTLFQKIITKISYYSFKR